jgi:hypothetical protein
MVDHWVETTAERKGDETVVHLDEKMVGKRDEQMAEKQVVL